MTTILSKKNYIRIQGVWLGYIVILQKLNVVGDFRKASLVLSNNWIAGFDLFHLTEWLIPFIFVNNIYIYIYIYIYILYIDMVQPTYPRLQC